jgi:hypothetical protein
MSSYARFANSDEQEYAIKKIESWLNKINVEIVGGAKIGKNYDTVILDLTYQGGEIYVHINGFEDTDYGNPGVLVNDVHIKENDFDLFKKTILEYS